MPYLSLFSLVLTGYIQKSVVPVGKTTTTAVTPPHAAPALSPVLTSFTSYHCFAVYASPRENLLEGRDNVPSVFIPPTPDEVPHIETRLSG